jgi:hypothetical protein
VPFAVPYLDDVAGSSSWSSWLNVAKTTLTAPFSPFLRRDREPISMELPFDQMPDPPMEEESRTSTDEGKR